MNAVVTGAGSGLGLAMCKELVDRGARVMAADIDGDRAAAAARALGSAAVPATCDVSDLAQVEELARRADAELAGVDLLVNNAGVAVAGPLGEVPMADWRWVFDVNWWGVLHGCQVFAPTMARHKRGAIINIASAAGLLSPPLMGPYNASKAAVISLSETLHAELAGSGVSVTVVCPTFFPSNLTQSNRTSINPRVRKLAQRLVERGRSTADQVARAALDGSARGALYVAPQLDARWSWRLKRLVPTGFHRLAGRAVPRILG